MNKKFIKDSVHITSIKKDLRKMVPNFCDIEIKVERPNLDLYKSQIVLTHPAKTLIVKKKSHTHTSALFSAKRALIKQISKLKFKEKVPLSNSYL